MAVSRPHAALGASTAHRWMRCPGSIQLAASIETAASSYAEEGEAAHMLAETCLRNGLNAAALIGRELNGHVVDAEMADGVQVYLGTVRAVLERGDTLLIEQQFSLDGLGPPGEMFGTADAVVYKAKPHRLVVFDFKYGGVPVEAEGNPQARYYGLGACMALAERPVTEVEIVIVQPRAPHPTGSIRRETVSAFELVEWSADLLEAAERTLDPEASLVPGAWCRFCPAAGICPALREHALATAQVEFTDAPLSSPPVRRNPAGRGRRAANRCSQTRRAAGARPQAQQPWASREAAGLQAQAREADLVIAERVVPEASRPRPIPALRFYPAQRPISPPCREPCPCEPVQSWRSIWQRS